MLPVKAGSMTSALIFLAGVAHLEVATPVHSKTWNRRPSLPHVNVKSHSGDADRVDIVP
jgi:hypothetical protein